MAPLTVRPVNPWRSRMLAALVVPCLLALTVWHELATYRKEVSDTEYLVSVLSQASATHFSVILRGIDQLLGEMAEVAPRGVPDDPRQALAAVSARMKYVPEIRSAVFIDGHGVMAAGTMNGMAGTDVNDREYVTRLRQDPSRQLFVSAPLSSRVVAGRSIVVARPIRDGAGQLLGIVAVALDPRIFEDELRSVLPDGGGRASLLRDDGIVLARVPDAADWAGRSVGGGEVMSRFGQAPAGTIVGTSITDGRRRVVAYRRIGDYPMVVVVGVPLAEALEAWRRDAILQGTAALVLALVTLGLAAMSDRRLAERQKMQQALAASDAKYRLLTEHSPVGVFQSDADGRCLYVNERWLDLAGRRRDEMLGGKWCDVVHPDDRKQVSALWSRLVTGDGDFRTEMRLVRGDGGIRWVRGQATCLSDVLGPAGGLVGTLEDVTAAKEAERLLSLSEQKFAKAFRASPDALVISTAEDGYYIELNDAFAAMLGYGRDEFLGRSANQLGVWVRPEDRAQLLFLLRRDGQAAHFETQLRRKDGHVLDVLTSVQELFIDGRDCLLFICRDITEAKAMEARTRDLLVRLDASNQELEQFAYVTSHDLQEPLRMIAGYAQLLDRRYRGRLDSDADEFISFLVDGAKRMQAMIHDLLEYSRVERLGGAFEDFPLEGLMADVLDNLRGALSEAGGVVEVGPLPPVRGDRTQILRLFQNLIGNAVKYRSADRRPQVRVWAEAGEEGWVFSVGDNGIGIDAAYFDRIFLVFQRLHTRQHYDGTGIGLAICKKIVERHGGRIWVDSVPGEGSIFHFTLARPAG